MVPKHELRIARKKEKLVRQKIASKIARRERYKQQQQENYEIMQKLREPNPKHNAITKQYHENKKKCTNKKNIICQQIAVLATELATTYTQQVCIDTIFCKSDI